MRTINEEKDGQQAACEMDSIVQGFRKIEAGDAGEAGVNELFAGFVVLEGPVFKEVAVDIFGDFFHFGVVDGLEVG